MAQTEIAQSISRTPAPSAFRKAGPGGFITSWRNFLFIIIAVAALAYGWRVTQVDFVSLVVNLPKSERIFTGLMQPDVIAQTYEMRQVQAPLQVGGVEAGRESRTEIPGGGSLVVSPSPIQPNQPLSITVTGAAPNSDLNLILVDFNNTPRPIRRNEKTDASGNYTLSFPFPASVGLGAYQVRAETATATGSYRLSETFVTALDKMIETIFLALMGTFFALVVSVPLSFLGARNLMQGSRVGWTIYYLVRTLFNVLRSIETLILAVIMAVVVGLGPFAGVMAIVIHSIGAMGKLYSESIESIDPGPIEAITATGANRLQVVLFAVLPQVVPQFLSFTMYRWDINVRLSTVIGLVGGGGIGFILIQYINLLQWNQAATALWLIGIVVIVMDYASAIIREKLV
ncbi:MAG: phosphonate ABC transporter, permease protein PhnE [Chloroflexi bacterium]|nr:phosphonate ABC transporter, permease protein PhnE [Chloroflexota bacterium]